MDFEGGRTGADGPAADGVAVDVEPEHRFGSVGGGARGKTDEWIGAEKVPADEADMFGGGRRGRLEAEEGKAEVLGGDVGFAGKNLGIVAGDAGAAGEALVFEDDAFGPELAEEGGGGGGSGVGGGHGGADVAGKIGICAAPGIDEEAVGAGDLEHVAGIVVAVAHGGHGDDVGNVQFVEEVEDGGGKGVFHGAEAEGRRGGGLGGDGEDGNDP